jgi:short-subunit dehydrogenase
VALNLDGATALVTGASSGIGRETARSLAARGARVAVTARRTDRLCALIAELPGGGHVALARDLAEPGAAEGLVEEAWERLAGLDVVVHNAGIPKRRHATAVTMDEVTATMYLNYEVPVRMTLATLPRMLERGRGCHVYVSSLGGSLRIGTEAAYCGSKFALAGWAEAVAIDLWDTPIEIRLCLPGAIETEIWDQPDNDPPLYDGPLEPATTVAEDIADQIEGERFEVYSPDMRAIVEWKTSDPAAFLAGVAEMARRKEQRPL